MRKSSTSTLAKRRLTIETLEQRNLFAIEAFEAGSYIIDMGQSTQTVANSLKPYGLVYSLVTDYKVPVQWAINPAKASFGFDTGGAVPIDFTATITSGTKSYRGGSFIIDKSLVTPAVLTNINAWKAQGVVVDQLAAPLSTEIYGEIDSFPKSVLDLQNGKIAVPFYSNAGIPTSSYRLGNPSNLNACDDVYIMPHADPQNWTSDWKDGLFDFVDDGGGLWAGCHAISALESLTTYNDGGTQQRLNFLSNDLVPWGSHSNGTPPYSYNATAANDPIMQIMNRLDTATLNGSEQIAVPTAAGWRNTTTVAVFDPDHPNNPAGGTSPYNKAAVVAYGHAYGDPTNGLVMYEASHSIAGTSTANVAAQRAFFNFLLTNGINKSPDANVVPPTIVAGETSTLSATISGGSGSYTYQWVSSNGGIFSKPAGTWVTGNAPITTSYQMTGAEDTIKLLITDSCGRQTTWYDSVSLTAPTLDLDLNNSTTATGADYKGYFTGNGTPVPAADLDTTITAGVTTIQSAVIDLTTRPNGAAETLLIDTALAASYGITVQSDGDAGFQLSGTASLAQYMAVIATLQYVNSLPFPSPSDRIIEVTINDGTLNSNKAVSRLSYIGGSPATVDKYLYLSDPGLGMDRIDPVAAGDNTTASVSFNPVVNDVSTGLATWSNKRRKNIEYRPWNLTSYGAQGTTAVDGSSYNTMSSAASTLRNEAIVVGVTTDRRVSGSVWNGVTWSPIRINVGGTVTPRLGTTTSAPWWGADVAYEATSGRAMLVWNTGTTLNYSLWNGSSWTAASTIPAYTGTEPRQIRLASDPVSGSNEVMMVVTDTNEVDRAIIWNGTSWGNAIQLDNNTGHNFTDVAVTYERQSGRAMVTYASGTTGSVGYRIWNGTTWTAAATITPPASGSSGFAQWTVTASDPNSNRIVLGVETSGRDAWMSVWDGNAWGTSTLGVTDGISSLGVSDLGIAVAFESRSGEALAVYQNDTNTTEMQARTWNATSGWSTGTNFGNFDNEETAGFTLSSNPYSDQIMLMVNDTDKELRSSVWSGSVFGSFTRLETDTNVTSGQPFEFIWDSYLPGAVTTQQTFTQTAPMTSPFVLVEGGAVKMTSYIRVTSGTFPASPKIGIELDHEQLAFFTMPGPPAVTPLGANVYKLEWTGVMPSSETIATGSAIDLVVKAFESGYTFDLLYDSATYPSQLQVETSTAITIDAAAVYTAAYPAGAPITAAAAGEPVYVRFTVADPFGSYDITGADLQIKDSLGNTVLPLTQLTNLNVVASTVGSKTYEYVWTPQGKDTFTLIMTAHEGTEGVSTVVQRDLIVTAAPDLVINKSDADLTVSPGGTVTYSLNYANQGLVGATGVVIREFLPIGSVFNAATSSAGWVAVSSNEYQFTVGNLAAGASGTALFAVTVPGPVSATLEALLNRVEIGDDGANGPDFDPSNNLDLETTPVAAAPDLVISKSDGGTTTLPGGIVLYQIQYSNVGTQDAIGVVIEELLPANTSFNSTFSFGDWDAEGNGVYSIAIGALPAGASGTVTFAVNVAGTLPGGVTQIVNTTSIEDGGTAGADPTPSNNTSTDATPIVNNPQADLRITKTNGLTSVTPGAVVSYTITVTNTGPNPVTGASFTDLVPSSLSGVSYVTSVAGGSTATPGSGASNLITGQLNLPVGSSVIYTVSGTLGLEATGELLNVATVVPPAGVVDPNTGNNTAIDQDPIVPISDLSLNKNYSYTDLDGSGSLTAGDRIVFVITVSNDGPHTARNVAVRELLPTGYQYVSDDAASNGDSYSIGSGLWTIGTLGTTVPSNTASLEITAIVTAGGQYTNVAEVIGSDSFDPDSTPGNQVASEDDYGSVMPPVQKKSDLAVTKTIAMTADLDNNGILSSGDQVTFTVTLGNLGPDAATGVTIADSLPLGYSFVSATPAAGTTYSSATGVWNVGSIDVLATKTLTIVAAIVGSQSVNSYTNTASISASDNFDPNLTNNSDTAYPQIADLSLTKAVDFAAGGDIDENGTPSTGDELEFTITVSNAGPDFATGVQTLDPLPTGFTFESDDSEGLYNPLTGVWDIGVIPPGSSRVLKVYATLNSSGVFANTAQVFTAQQFDPDSKPNNNASAEDDQSTVTVVPSVGSQPPVAANDRSLGNVAGAVTLNVTGNDSDSNLNLAIDTVDLNLAAAGRQTSLVVAGEGTWSVDDSGFVTFTPLPSFTLDPTPISYRISDTTALVSNIATITIDYVPVASNDSSSGHAIGAPVTVAVLGNDTTGDSAVPGTIRIVGTNTAGSPLVVFGEGTWSVNTTSGAITFTPAVGFQADPTPIRYTVNDNDGNVSNAALVTIDYNAPIPTADLRISKTDNATQAVPGTDLSYVIVVTNDGPFDVTGAVVNDTLPPTLQNVTWTVSYSLGSSGSTSAGTDSISGVLVNLLAAGTATFTVSGTINPTATGVLSNTATVTAPSGIVDPNPNNNSATDQTTLTPQGDLSITKTDGSILDLPGTSIVYSVIVRNNGTSVVTGARMTDVVPANITGVTWTAIYTMGSSGPASGTGNAIDAVFNLRPNAFATFTVSGTIDAAATGVLTNTAIVTAPPTFTDTNPNNNSATDQTTLTPTADLVITKTDDKATAIPGTANSYTIVVTNNGPSDVLGALVNDDLPAAIRNVTWAVSYSNGSSGVASGTGDITNAAINLLAGGTATFIVNGTLRASDVGTITNTASVDLPAGIIDPDLSNNHADDETVMTPRGDIAVTKTDGLINATPGTQITYTITVTNFGPSSLTDAILNDALPANLTNVSWTAQYSDDASGQASGSGSPLNVSFGLMPLSTATFYVTGTILASATGTLSNTATVTPLLGFVDTNAANNSATDTTNLVPAGDLAITKTDNITAIAAGGAITYSIVVSNNGPSDVVGATINDILPASIISPTWTVTYSSGSGGSVSSGAGNISGVSVNLKSGGTATFTVSGTVSGTATGTLSNTATVTPPVSFLDANSANNSATDTTLVSANYDLSITKTDNQTTAYPGSPISYTIVVTNSGPSNISGAVVNDGLPAAVQNASWSVSYVNGSGTTGGTGTVTNAVVNLLSGGTATFVINGTVASGFVGTLSNTATVTPPDALDAVSANNSASDSTQILPAADLAITKSNGATAVVPGTQTTYTISVTNLGPSAISGAGVVDFLPAGTTFVTATGGAVYNPSTRTVSYTSGLLAQGGTTSFDVTLAITSNLSGTLTNTATVTAPAGVFDPNPANNSASDTDPLTPQGNLSIVKTNGDAAEVPGGEVMYTIVVTNSGPSVLQARVQDVLPASLSDIGWTAVFTGLTSTGNGTGTGNIDEVILLHNGGTATYVVHATLDAGATGTLVNTATVTPQPGYTDPNPNDNSDTETTPIAPRGDLSVTKVDNVAVSAIPGERMGYTIVVSNAGPSNVIGAVVEDLLPAAIIAADWTVVYSSGSSGSVSSGTGNISNALVNLLSGGTATFTIDALLCPCPSGSMSNSVTVTPPAGFTDTNPANNRATETTLLTPTGDLSITKTDFQESDIPGTGISYTIVVSNAGPSSVQQALINDPLSAQLTGATWTATYTGASVGPFSGSGSLTDVAINLVAGTTATFTVIGTIDPTATGTLSNTATITAPQNYIDTNLANNSATDRTALVPTADLSILKTNGVGSIVPGTTSTYIITVTNSGPSTVSGATVADVLPSGVSFVSATGGATYSGGNNTVSFVSGTLAQGASTSFALTVLVGAGLSGQLANSATVSPPSGVQDATPGNNTSTDTDTLAPLGDLTITKTDGQTSDVPGTGISYTIVVTNSGPSDVAGARINDTFPSSLSGTTWSAVYTNGSGAGSGIGSLANVPINLLSGGSATFTVFGTINPLATGVLSNTATVTAPSSFTDSNPNNNSATDQTTLTPQGDLSITKTDGLVTDIPGTPIVYTVVVTNSGPSNVIAALVNDVLPAGIANATWTVAYSTGSSGALDGTGSISNAVVNLLPSGTATFTISGTIDASATGVLTNTAIVTAPPTFTDTNPNNNSATDQTTLTPSGDLSITKTDGRTTDIPGTSIGYTIVVSNSGPSQVTGAMVNDTVPDDIDNVAWSAVYSGGSTGPTSGTGSLVNVPVNLLSGGTATFIVSGTINPSATGVLTNTATVAAPANFTDANSANNSAIDTTTLIPTVDLTITKTDGQTTDIPGSGIIYTVVVSNTGPSDVSGATITDLLPASITAASWTAIYSGDAYGANGGVGSIVNLPIDLPVGGIATFTISGTISPTATGVLSNTASVSPPMGVYDTNLTNNSATDSTTLTPMVDLRLAKTNSVSSLTPGLQTTYTLTVFNYGTIPVAGATVVDNLPAGLTFVSGSAGVVHNAGTVTYTAGSLAGNATESFTITVLVGANVGGSISNIATVTPPSGYIELTPENNSATDTDSISAEVDLSVTITDGSSVYRENGTTVYTVVVKNDGPGVAAGARVDAALPPGASGGSWTATFTNGSSGSTSGSGAISQPITLLPGGVATYTYRVSVGAGTSGKLVGQAQVTKPAGMIEANLADNTDVDLGYLPVVVTGTEIGCKSAPFITVIDPYTGAIRTQFNVFESKFRGGVRVALGDVDGDGIDEIIAAAGSGRLGEILVFRLDGTPMPAYRTVPFGTKYTSGVEIAVGDVDGDGIDDIVASASRGAGNVNVYRVNPAAADPVPNTPTRTFRAFSTKFLGGASIAVADMGSYNNGSAIDRTVPDGRAEIIVGSGSGMLPQVMIYDVSGTPAIIDTIKPMTVTPKYRNGVSVSAGRFNGDAIPEVIIAAGRSGGTVYEMYDGVAGPGPNAQASRDAVFADIAKATSPLFSAGIDLDGDGQIDRMFNTQGDNGTSPYPGIRVTDMDGDLMNTITSLKFSQRIAASQPRLPEPQVMMASGLIYEDIEVGNGPIPLTGQTVSINYIVSAQNGNVLQNTYLSGSPLSLQLGNSQVITGLNEAIASMRIGGRRQVIIPVNLASGSVPSGLPVNATLVFDIELLSVRP